MRLSLFLLASALAGVTTASAQTTGASCPVVPHRGSIPYSLVRIQMQVQTLSNGVQITNRSEAREWHDAAGRTRLEARVERNGEMELQNVSISDPVLREGIILHPKSQVAELTRYTEPPHQVAFQQRPVDKAFQEAMKPEYQVQPRTSRIENKNESLGTSVIAGECAQGTRWTQIVPAGEMGNDGEIRTVSENWWSPRLGIQLRSVTDDPRSGHMVNEVTELHLEAPDPSVFQPPPDYQVFDLTREPANP